MKFNEYVNLSVVCSDLMESVEETSLPTMYESLDLMEQELNELLGLGKVAEKLKGFASDAKEVGKNIAKDVGGKIASDAKEVAQSHKEIAQAVGKKAVEAGKKVAGSKAAEVAKGVADSTVGKFARDMKEVGKSHAEIAQAAKDKLVALFSKSQSAFKDIWASISKENLTDDQRSVLADLAAAQQKMTTGKFLNGDDSVKVLAAILAGKGSVPSSKKYAAKLEELKAIPGIATVRVAARVK